MKKIALSIFCSLIIALGGFYLAVIKPVLANVTCSLPFTLTNGTIADATQVMANYNALVTCFTNAAAAGANNDITSLSGLTTPITPGEGGSNVYIGSAPTASGADLTIATTSPTNYANTRGYTVIFTAVATNTSVQTLSVNGQTKKNIFKQSTAGPVALSGGEIVPNQQYLATYDGTQFQINPVPSLAIGFGLSQGATLTSFNTTNPPLGFGPCNNMTISATVGANLLGLQLFAADTGVAPTAIHPIFCNFRDSTIANGDPLWASMTSAVYMDTNAAGASLGTLANLPFRLWVVLFYNGGTPKLGLWQSTSFTVGAQAPQGNNITMFTMDESALQSPTAISAAATSAGTFYTSNGLAISNSPVRILGYFDFNNGMATAGSYTAVPSKIQLFGPGIKKPGDRLTFVKSTLATATSSANTYTPSATKPVPTNGTTVTSIVFSPIASMDVINLAGMVNVSTGGGGNVGGAFIHDGSVTVANSTSFVDSSARGATVGLTTIVTAASKTFVLYGFAGAANTCINGTNSGCLTIGGQSSWLAIEEIQP